MTRTYLSNRAIDLHGAEGRVWYYEESNGLHFVTDPMADDGRQLHGMLSAQAMRGFLARLDRERREKPKRAKRRAA